jgi:haloalkane dehalogenase
MAWEELSPHARARGQVIRTPGGENLVLGQDMLIRQAFTGGGVLNPVSTADLDTYLAPYPDPDSRHPVLAWTRMMPLGGQPGHHAPEDRPEEIAAAIAAWADRHSLR